jgi:hypothetical protein
MARQTNQTEDIKKDSEAKERPAAPASHSHFSTGPTNRGWLYGVGAAVIVILVFLAGAGVASHRHQDMVFKTGGFAGMPGGGYSFEHHGFGGGGFGSGTTSANGQTVSRGVVTSVNGTDFTIAGNGGTTNVTTDSSTQYQNGSQVKQNDSVVIWGTQKSGTITASRVVINP